MRTNAHSPVLRSAQALIAVALAGLGLAAIVPSMASAASSCSFGKTSRNAIVQTDTARPFELLLRRSGKNIQVLDDAGSLGHSTLCRASDGTIATVENADAITLLGVPDRGLVIDQSNGTFAPGFNLEPGATREIEIRVAGGTGKELRIKGTNGPDTVRVGGRGEIMLGNDAGIDILPAGGAGPFSRIRANLSGGNDFATGRGAPGLLAATTVPLQLFGERGADTLVDGLNPGNSIFGGDDIFGDEDDDTLFTADGHNDDGGGGLGFDRATIDAIDTVGAEQVTVSGAVGKLQLTPAAVNAGAGKLAQLRMSWQHPHAWKQLRTIRLRVNRGAEVLGAVTITPRDGRMRSSGDVKVLADDSKLTHHDKTVTAQLAVRMNRSLAEQDLRLDVEATDRNGRTQIEPDAGAIRVGK